MKYMLFAVLNMLPLLAIAQNHFIISDEGQVNISNGHLVLTNAVLSNAGVLQAAQGKTIVEGDAPAIESSIGGTGTTQFADLEIDKIAYEVLLESDIEVVGNVIMNQGRLNLNGYDLLLADENTGQLIGESEVSYIYGTAGGEIVKTINLNNPNDDNPGNLGLVFNSSNNLGTITIRRGHSNSTSSLEDFWIKRYYELLSSNPTATTDLRIHYLDTELNELEEQQLILWQDVNYTDTWQRKAGVSYANTNSIVFNNVQSTGIITLGSNVLFVSTKIALPSIYDNSTNLMDANITDVLPSTEPYSELGHQNLQNAGVSTTFPDTTPNASIVDWVLIELRDATTAENILALRAALLQRDGDIVDVDGKSPVPFENIATGNYHIAVRHRNHLGVMTAMPVLLDY